MSIFAERLVADLQNTLRVAMDHDGTRRALVVYDEDSELSKLLTAGYRQALPTATFTDFNTTEQPALRAQLDLLAPLDLAILVQSASFRPTDYRIRVELYKRNVKVIEHGNLLKMTGEAAQYYLDALAYDPEYYRGVGHNIRVHSDAASSLRIASRAAGAEQLLTCAGPLEEAKINLGDFRTLSNFGSQFPIGEVFTEARDLSCLSGEVAIYGFMDLGYYLNAPAAPIVLSVAAGIVQGAANSTADFDALLKQIEVDEGCVRVREIGFGMNRSFSRERLVPDVGAFERACGIHLSLGAKHSVYKKPDLRHKDARHHVDVFVCTEHVWFDDTLAYRDGGWCLPVMPY
jgi:aminopeptidase